MADLQDRSETGNAYMIIGWLCWLFAFLVMFFNPAAIKLGKLTMVEIAAGLAIIGVVMNLIGYRVRTR